ncbi:potassium transporter TrkA [Micromonospora sp. WMMD882]|uniref:potassium transporter TrkA n=1 Tax=Micromonospora sp. WMMD882 TaxID=3015151 RepID=UPI00248C6A98|nr:potassium transporter TrkA [Micromonospora sp. WMMD882]WBB78056.1 potassium transporter TrkA [Micromonospora sp. WMMD882]
MNRVVVVGSGSLARAVCNSTAVVADRPVTVTVVGRDASRAAEVAYVAGARAALSGTPARFRSAAVAFGDDTAQGDRPDRSDRRAPGGDLAALLADETPDAVLHCASVQSPWESVTAPSGWTRLLAGAGFGVTAPLHALLASRVAGAVRRSGVPARVLNACFPDAVNPILAALGLPVDAGVGNVALLTASLRAALRLGPDDRLRVLAHHVHLYPPDGPEREALAWTDDGPVADVTGGLSGQRSCRRAELNAVTGHTAALLLRDWRPGAVVRTNLPGPNGLPGGYPVRVTDDGIALDLPPGWDRARAVDWNVRAGAREGVRVDGDRVRFTGSAVEALRGYVPDLAEGFAVTELESVAARLLDLRDGLRPEPATTS